MKHKQRPFVFLDRDGTVLVEKSYLCDPQQVEILDGVTVGLRKLRDAGCGLILVTNQSGIGRGYFSVEEMHAVHSRLVAMLQQEGIVLDGMYFCPHAPDENCSCRKPKTGMLEAARHEHGITTPDCYVVGDKSCDIDLALNAGYRGVLVRTGYGRQEEKKCGERAHAVTDTFEDAADWIIAGLKA